MSESEYSGGELLLCRRIEYSTEIDSDFFDDEVTSSMPVYLVQRIDKRFKLASKDIISRMPENVMTTILDRLPIQEAVRTSILSRSWRFAWTMLTRLVFDDKFFGYLLSRKLVHRFYKMDLLKLLLHHKGSVTKFVLYIPAEKGKHKKEYNVMYADIVMEINHWILSLSTKGVKKITIINMRNEPLKLPNHLFSCLELKYLKLRKCCLHPDPGFHFFQKLLAFDLDLVTYESCKYGEFITLCPTLEYLEIGFETLTGEVKLGEIAKLVNLKMLSLMLHALGDAVVTSLDIFQLMGFLPKLEKLNLDFRYFKLLAKADACKRFSANLHCLKKLALSNISFEDHIMIECACDLINGLPNLQTLKMTRAPYSVAVQSAGYPIAMCTIKANLRLQYVEFDRFSGSEIEVDFIKSLLLYSPLLKKMVIKGMRRHDHTCCTFARKLLKLHRASPVVDIDLH